MLEHHLSLIQKAIGDMALNKQPAELYDPIRYFLSLGGKRIRPILVLLSCEMWGKQPESAIKQALAVEVFHNFTLMHDDIMDHAPLRRGMPTVHQKWNTSTAILSGDIMMIQAIQLLSQCTPTQLPALLEIFNTTAIEVCEGQQLDMNFEQLATVNEEEYIQMIRLKTAVLLGCALKIGAIVADADIKDAEHLYAFGTEIGIAFQLQDDILDVFGNTTDTGKRAGGDILTNKKTYLLIKALKEAQGEDAEELRDWINKTEFDEDEKIAAVKALYEKANVRTFAEALMNKYFNNGLAHLAQVSASDEQKMPLLNLAKSLMIRTS
jgi:geranylgeranyl diphosphate synthase type II